MEINADPNIRSNNISNSTHSSHSSIHLFVTANALCLASSKHLYICESLFETEFSIVGGFFMNIAALPAFISADPSVGFYLITHSTAQ